MALDVYFKEDIANVLRSTEHSTCGLLEKLEETNEEYARGYREGRNVALTAIALAFGLMKDK